MVGILLICTGKYDKFVTPLLDSMENNFLADHKKKYFLFSDKSNIDNRAFHIKIERKGFPGDTLYRFHHFLSIEKKLREETSYLYYSDVDMLCVNQIGGEILPNKLKPLVGVAHPGFYMKSLGTPEDRTVSSAYIHHDEYRPCYWAGGLSGGETDTYLQMCNQIKNCIDSDDSKGLVARWHDESHLNRYFTSNLNLVKTMNPSYCYSRSLCHGNPYVTPRLVALDKNHEEVRS